LNDFTLNDFRFLLDLLPINFFLRSSSFFLSSLSSSRSFVLLSSRSFSSFSFFSFFSSFLLSMEPESSSSTLNPRKLLPLAFLLVILLSILYVTLRPTPPLSVHAIAMADKDLSANDNDLSVNEVDVKAPVAISYPRFILFGDSHTSALSRPGSGTDALLKLSKHCERKCDLVIRGEEDCFLLVKTCQIFDSWDMICRLLRVQHNCRKDRCPSAVPDRHGKGCVLHDSAVWDERRLKIDRPYTTGGVQDKLGRHPHSLTGQLRSAAIPLALNMPPSHEQRLAKVECENPISFLFVWISTFARYLDLISGVCAEQ